MILSLVPVGGAASMLRRSADDVAPSRRPPQRVPAESRLVFRSGVVRAG